MIQIKLAGLESRLLPRLAELISQQVPYQGTITAKVVSANEVKRLNREYAGHNAPTDVLSFSYIEDVSEDYPEELGDIVISREHIKTQAARAGTDEETELILLLLHGCLHILGFDHGEAKERAQMDRLQAEIMVELGLSYRDFGWLDKPMVT